MVKQKVEMNALKARERIAAFEARRLLIEEWRQREDQLEQLMDKVRALMDEGFHGNHDAFDLVIG